MNIYRNSLCNNIPCTTRQRDTSTKHRTSIPDVRFGVLNGHTDASLSPAILDIIGGVVGGFGGLVVVILGLACYGRFNRARIRHTRATQEGDIENQASSRTRNTESIPLPQRPPNAYTQSGPNIIQDLPIHPSTSKWNKPK